MDAAKDDSARLDPWRERWRELTRRVRGNGAHHGKTHRKAPRAHAGGEVHGNFSFPTSSWVDAVEEARRDWMNARSHFDAVEDPDLIDHAIYQVQAAESRYMYLLRKVREGYRDRDGSQGVDPLLARSSSR